MERTDLSPDATSGTSVTLILEPVGGGGDIQEHTPDGRRIQQLKAGTHSWSLQDIVADVLPDLYLEVDIDRSEDSYEFVTEGWRGNWKEACDFFGSLNIRQCPDSDVLDALDNTRSIRFGHQTSGKDPFWPDSTYTERTLFERIASNLLKSSPTVQQLGHDTNILHRNLWHLLGHFKFIENQKSSHLQSKIDRVLLEIVPINTNLPATRDALLFDLARRASVGGAQIVPSTFFAENGLQAVPLSHWTAIQDNATHILKRQLNRLGYIPEEDVRVAEPPMSWPLQTPLLALTGESGQGKSWWLFNLALQLSDTNPVVLISSINNAERDMQAAAQIFANIADQDNNLRLERVAARLKTIGSPHHQLWLYLLIDDVQEVSVARRLALQDWEEWGIVPVIAGNPDAIRAFSETANSRGVVCEAGDFSIPQLQRYLTDGDILTFYTIPGDVRDTLRRPLLARLYRDLVRETLYRPENEYELYAL
ncbi:MAG TPA: hypothetical protein VKU00_32730, partial [Chthonomonadaceae bacterium]|nr:hypothetical protein [Chthonomonadaceae bacterium]